jgi:NAD(P)-dependent dehydrogenase (short-subunit alcohol dehydrogenase family)
MSQYDLSGRCALVTGGARGLGAGMARGLTDGGARVLIADVLKDAGEQTAAVAEPPDATVMIVGTGGTTGRPKGVQLPSRTSPRSSRSWSATASRTRSCRPH